MHLTTSTRDSEFWHLHATTLECVNAHNQAIVPVAGWTWKDQLANYDVGLNDTQPEQPPLKKTQKSSKRKVTSMPKTKTKTKPQPTSKSKSKSKPKPKHKEEDPDFDSSTSDDDEHHHDSSDSSQDESDPDYKEVVKQAKKS